MEVTRRDFIKLGTAAAGVIATSDIWAMELKKDGYGVRIKGKGWT